MTRSSGVDINGLDAAHRPQDDLYLHVNSRWLEANEIPADRARYGEFLILADGAEQAVREIVEAAGADDPSRSAEQQKFGDLYASFMDETRIESLGGAPIAADVAAALRPATVAELVQTTGELEARGAAGFFGLFVDNDPGDPDRYVVFLTQGGLGLPDESYYREEKFADVRTAYLAHIERMLALADVPEPGANARLVFDLETEIATKHWDVVACRDIQKLYNLRTFAELEALTPTIDWPTYLRAADVPQSTVAELVVAQPDAIEGIAALLTDDRLPAWRAWLAWQVVHGAAPFLSAAFVDENFSFYGHALSGTPELRPRWKRAVGLVQGGLGEAVGRVYVERFFPPAAKARMDELVANLILAYHDSISSLSWMSEGTKQRALEKLALFTPKIGYPVKWRDYSALSISRDDLVANVRAIGVFTQRRELGKIGKPIDRDEWFMTPQTVNAYYNPGFNEIVFPAAILQPPFFDLEADDAANYGAIGGVIGHEIGHGFDDQGAKYDGHGALHDWWTDTDRAEFEKLTKALIAQYDALESAEAPGHHVNGALTVGENIGDLGGLTVAWKAYVASLGGEPAPVIDGLSGAERFFLAWARVWAEKRRPAEALRLLAIDPHSPEDLRCNQIARNLPIFHATFGTHPGDGMWLDPADRVAIW